MNIVVLCGVLSHPPVPRTLPSGDVLVGYDVTCARVEGHAESVPVVWPAAPAGALRLAAGDEVLVVGRVRRRFYRAGGATASRTEVVADRVVPARHARRAEAALDAARRRLEALPSR